MVWEAHGVEVRLLQQGCAGLWRVRNTTSAIQAIATTILFSKLELQPGYPLVFLKPER